MYQLGGGGLKNQNPPGYANAHSFHGLAVRNDAPKEVFVQKLIL